MTRILCAEPLRGHTEVVHSWPANEQPTHQEAQELADRMASCDSSGDHCYYVTEDDMVCECL